MIYLFGPAGLNRLEKLWRANALLAFDFDGTLAPMASEPELAGMRPSTVPIWKELTRIANTAVITGRSRKDAATKFKVMPHFLVGNHGLEGTGKDRSKLFKAKQIVKVWKRPLATRLHGLGGVEIEDKTFSLSVHYRRARHHGRAKTAIFEEGSRLSPVPRMIPGKCVVNLVPAGSPNKGTALLELMKQMKTKVALYVGDDHTDEDVFRLKQKGILKVCVGKRKESGAEFFIRNQREIDRLLKELLRFL